MTAKNTNDEFFMKRCIELAKQGLGYTSPNPMVGSVIVYEGKIIGEGYHQKCGEAHAEVNAINSVTNKDLLKLATIYVSLEPCAHFGKTPPCANLIVEHKIPNVVIGMQDPFAKVDGAGIKILENAGCSMKIGILEAACRELNQAFICYHTKKRPYIVLKWAETLDGFIDVVRKDGDPQQPNWITNEVCRSLVHKWRSESDAILVGPQTALTDNPKLNVRSWTGKNPTRIILDRNLKLPHNLHVFDKSQPTLLINTIKDDKEKNLHYIKLDATNFIENTLEKLQSLNIQSVFIEGGKEILQQFIDKNLWDEARIFTGNRNFQNGLKAPLIKGKIISKDKLKDNYLMVINNNELY